jgi:hypothetical protein
MKTGTKLFFIMRTQSTPDFSAASCRGTPCFAKLRWFSWSKDVALRIDSLRYQEEELEKMKSQQMNNSRFDSGTSTPSIKIRHIAVCHFIFMVPVLYKYLQNLNASVAMPHRFSILYTILAL